MQVDWAREASPAPEKLSPAPEKPSSAPKGHPPRKTFPARTDLGRSVRAEDVTFLMRKVTSSCVRQDMSLRALNLLIKHAYLHRSDRNGSKQTEAARVDAAMGQGKVASNRGGGWSRVQ